MPLFRLFPSVVLLVWLSAQYVYAQDKKFEVETAIIDKLSFKVAGWKNLVIPIVGYEPLTRLVFGIGALSTKRLSKDSTLPTSYAEFDLVYTQNQQLLLEDEVFLYLGSKYLLKGYVGFAKFPDRYWGLGSHTPDADLQRYNNFRYYANIHFLRKIRKSLYAGVKYRLFGMYNLQTLSSDPPTLRGAAGENGGINSGLGYTFIWDNRENILNAHRGMYINVAHTFFGKYVGSQFDFTRFEFDVRKFIGLKHHHVIALQTVGVFNTGTPSFPMMALLGSDGDMRGYYKGRYRDLDYFSVQAEYRLPLFWRIGMVAFAGAGDVAHSLSKFKAEDFKYSLGGGLRFLINKKENINFRVDYALGYHSDGLYFYLGEAF